jgi:hypothetical protein
VRLVSAGIPRAIAQRLTLAVIALLVAAAPAAADPLGETAAASAATAGGLPAQATQGVAGTLPAVGQAAGALPQPAGSVRRAAEAVPRAAERAKRAADALPQPAEPVRGAADGLSQPAEPVRGAAEQVQRAAGAEPPASRPVGDALRAAASPGDALRAAASPGDAGPGGSLPSGTEAADSTTRAVGELGRGAAVALQSLGDGLRSLLPVDALGPVAGLLAGAGLADLVPGRLALGRLLPGSGPVALDDGPPLAGARDVLGAQARPTALAPPLSAGGGGPALTPSQSSAQPPAAEAGGRPGSSSPRKAPAPTTGGAAAAGPGGLSFVPFLGLLVLAALAAPMLLRRLGAATASLRPAPFICALERPG